MPIRAIRVLPLRLRTFASFVSSDLLPQTAAPSIQQQQQQLERLILMLTGPFEITPAPVIPPAPDETIKPGAPAFVVTPEILLDFAHCPARLAARGKAPEPSLTNHAELARHYHLDPNSVALKFARRPDTYPTLALTCPRCNSVSTAQVCRRCNTSRVNRPVTKPWAYSAPECRKWKAEQEDLGRTIVTNAQDQAAKLAVARLAADPEIVEFTGPKPTPTLLSGFWQDAATGRKVPVAAPVDYLPEENSTYGAALGFLLFTTDGALGGWTRSAYYSGLHVRAALALDLFNAAADHPAHPRAVRRLRNEGAVRARPPPAHPEDSPGGPQPLHEPARLLRFGRAARPLALV